MESEAGASNKRVVRIITEEVGVVRKLIPVTEHLFWAKHIKKHLTCSISTFIILQGDAMRPILQ